MGKWAIQASAGFQDLESVYGFKVTQMPGTGVAPVNNRIIDYATLNGGFWQSKRFESRTFTLVGVISGSNLAALHANRAKLISDLGVSGSNPTVLRYSGATQTVTASAYYDGGLEIGSFTVAREADLALRFVMPTGNFVGASTSASLATTEVVTFKSGVFRRKQTGQWDSMNNASPIPAGNALLSSWMVMTEADNKDAAYIAMGTGFFGTGSLFVWHNEQWQKYYGNFSGLETAWLTKGPGASSMFIGGIITSVNGSTAGNLAKIDGGSASVMNASLGGVSGTTFHNGIYSPTACKLYMSYLGTSFVVNGASTAASALVYWQDGASTLTNWTALARTPGASTHGELYGSTRLNDGRLAWWGNCNLIAGSTGFNNFIIYDPSTSTWNNAGSGLDISFVSYSSPAQLIDNSIVVAGCGIKQTYAASTPMPGIARWNGTSWSANYGGTLKYTGILTNWGVVTSRMNKRLYLTGTFTEVNGIPLTSNTVVIKNGWFVPVGFALGSTPAAYGYLPDLQIAEMKNGELIFAMYNSGSVSGSFPGYTLITNSGGDIYPVFSASGPGRIYQLSNFTLGLEIFFNYNLQSGEVITMDFNDPLRRLTSNISGDITSKIAQGSDVTSWRLTGGSNHISCYISGGAGKAKLTWASVFSTLDN